MTTGYMELIASNYPNVKCRVNGYSYAYEDIIHEGGDPIPPKSELDALLPNAEKEAIWQQIKEFRDAKQASGFLAAGKWWHSDDQSRIKYLGLMMMGAGIPSGLMWKTMDGTFVEMTQTLAGTIFQTIAGWDSAIFLAAETHNAAMRASSNPSQYVYDQSGWPASYGA